MRWAGEASCVGGFMKRTTILSGFLLAAGLAWAEPASVPVSDASADDALFITVESTETPVLEVPASTAAAVVGATLKIRHPPSGARLPYLKNSFVYGSATPGGRLTVNGQEVPIHTGGGWLAVIPFSTGRFDIKAELTLPATTLWAVREVFVAQPSGTSPSRPLTIEYIKPDQTTELRPGDSVNVLCKGSPGMEGTFRIDDVRGTFPLVENSSGAAVRGVYRGMYVVQDRDDFKKAKLRVTLRDRKRGNKITREAPGRLNRMGTRTPEVVEVSTDIAILRTGPGFSQEDKLGYIMFPPPGVRMEVAGRQGEEVRVRLSPSKTAWIGSKEVRTLPSGTPAPRTTAGSLSVVYKEPHTEVRLPLGQKVPFEVRPAWDGKSVDVLLYGAVSNTDWQHYDSAGGAATLVQWFQEDSETLRLRVETPPKSWWGVDGRYEGSTFVLELRSPPPLSPKSPWPLEGLTVAVDAGHSFDVGSMGPTGLLEKDVNLDIALCLKKKLIAEKATVYMVREGTENVPLYDRPKMAWRARADILVSVHNNALPDGANPWERNGYGVYYFQPHGFDLAREIHASYGRHLGRAGKNDYQLRDDGLHYGNLALPRTPQMPAVLTESAYMILPQEEAWMRTEAFQCACAESILEGVKNYVEPYRHAQQKIPSPAWRPDSPGRGK